MPRAPREDIGGEIYHCINRANARMQIFFEKDDYELFEEVLIEMIMIHKTRVLAYCVMPNHFHLVIKTITDGELSKCMRWLTLTHTQRWHQKYGTTGSGHLYQGRYKSFRISDGNYLSAVLRYVERNPIAAKLTRSALEWPYGSVYKRHVERARWLASWPIAEPVGYLKSLESGSDSGVDSFTTPH